MAKQLMIQLSLQVIQIVMMEAYGILPLIQSRKTIFELVLPGIHPPQHGIHHAKLPLNPLQPLLKSHHPADHVLHLC